MRTIIPRTKKDKEDTSAKMDPIMKAVKAVHSVISVSDVERSENLARQRSSQELLYKLITPAVAVSHERVEIDGIPTQWSRADFPHRHDRIIMYCHGGGYTCGGLGYAGILAGKLVMHTGLDVFSFEYRLAPENPYPAAIEDAVTMWDHLMYMGYGAHDIIVVGDSAGGNLALELTLVLQSQGRQLPAALVLMSPWTDMTVTSSSYEKYKDSDPMLTAEYVYGVRNAYAGGETDFTNPSLSPLYADLVEMPPTLIQVGSNEILRGDSEDLYKKLHKNGCMTHLKVYSGGWHVFQMLPMPKAARALDDVDTFIRELNL